MKISTKVITGTLGHHLIDSLAESETVLSLCFGKATELKPDLILTTTEATYLNDFDPLSLLNDPFDRNKTLELFQKFVINIKPSAKRMISERYPYGDINNHSLSHILQTLDLFASSIESAKKRTLTIRHSKSFGAQSESGDELPQMMTILGNRNFERKRGKICPL